MRALIADDERVTTTILSAALRQWKLDVSIAHDGGAAWDLLVHERPPLVILDWMMPTVDGPDLCRRIRATPLHARTYVILLTSRSDSADLVTGLDAGADDYLIKPFDREELRARVQVGVRVATLQERLAERVVELEAALSKVRQLEGFLPICSYCKRIRSDQDCWEQMERYISQHSNAQFSHGICPSCFEKASKDFEG